MKGFDENAVRAYQQRTGKAVHGLDAAGNSLTPEPQTKLIRQAQKDPRNKAESRPSSVTSLHPYGAALVSTNSAAPFSTRGRL